MLKRKVTDAIRYVFRDDDALQTAEGIEDEAERKKREEEIDAAYDEYLDGGCDWAKLPLKEGAKPTVFVIKQMTHRQKIERQSSYPGGFPQACFTFRCVVSGVENYSVEMPDGEIQAFDVLKRKKVGNLGALITEKQLEDLHLSMNEISTIALAGLAISESAVPLLRHCVSRAGELE